jgi:hypothetical protein
MRAYVEKSRVFALEAAKWLVPRRPFDVWALAQLARLITHTPPMLARALANLSGTARLHDSMTLKDYDGCGARPARVAGARAPLGDRA